MGEQGPALGHYCDWLVGFGQLFLGEPDALRKIYFLLASLDFAGSLRQAVRFERWKLLLGEGLLPAARILFQRDLTGNDELGVLSLSHRRLGNTGRQINFRYFWRLGQWQQLLSHLCQR